MSQPLYFLPNLRAAQCENVALRRAMLKERDLTEVFADVPMVEQSLFDVTGRGPGDKSGCILAYQTPAGDVPTRLGYYPNEQTWTPVGDGSLVWIGIDPSDPPKPADLARRKQYASYGVTCGDGNQWAVPVIRRPDDSTDLPTDMVWDATGRFIEPIKPAYQSFWTEAAEFSAWYYGGGYLSGQFPAERGVELAIRALSINYRFGRNEQNMLRVVDRDCYEMILSATVDAPNAASYVEAEKKTSGLLSTANTTPGSQDDCQVIDQPAATCG
jgi:hypothetical protein